MCRSAWWTTVCSGDQRCKQCGNLHVSVLKRGSALTIHMWFCVFSSKSARCFAGIKSKLCQIVLIACDSWLQEQGGCGMHCPMRIAITIRRYAYVHEHDHVSTDWVPRTRCVFEC